MQIYFRFEISFEFRTLHTDGLLLYLSNLDHTAFLALELKEGAVVMSYDRRKGSVKRMPVKTKESLADGEWHSVVVKKNLQRITVTVDQAQEKGGKIAKVLKVDVPLYIGGVPKTFLPLVNRKVVSIVMFLMLSVEIHFRWKH